MEKIQCYFLDRDDTILFVRDDAITFVVGEADLELDCSFPIDTEKPIRQGMKIGFYDIDNKLVFYEIRTVEEDAISMTTEVYAEHALIAELLEDPLTDVRVTNATALQALSAVLDGSRWQARTTIETSVVSSRFWYINRWEALKQIQEKWQVAFDFSWAIDDTGIVSRYVDIISKDPVNRGKRFDILKDISSLKVTYDDTEVCTALYGRGADEKTDEKDQDEDGNTYDHKISFASVVWSTQSGDPADKPSGQQYVEDTEATALYGRSGRMRAQFIDFSNTTDPAELLRLTWNALQLVNKPKVTIKATVADLEKIWGYKHEAVRLNDWGFVIADSIKAQIETTVVDIKRDYINPQQTKITLGNKVITISDIQAEYQAKTRRAEEEARRASGTAAAASEKVDQTREELLIEFAGAQSAIYSSLSMTAEELQIEFTNGISDLHSQIHVTAEELYTEFQASNSQIYSSIRQTAEDLQIEFASAASGIYTSISATASELQTEFSKADSKIYGSIKTSADGIKTEFGNALSGVYSSISVTAEELQTEFHSADSAIYSRILQNETSIDLVVGKKKDGTNYVKGASLILAINETVTGQQSYSDAILSADVVQINGGNGSIKLSDKIIIESSGYTKLVGHVLVANSTYNPGYNVDFNNGKVTAHDVQVRSGGSLIFSGTADGEHYDLDAVTLQNVVTGFGNVSSDQQTGVVSIPYKTVRYPTAGSNSQTINFNIADMAYHINALSAARSSIDLRYQWGAPVSETDQSQDHGKKYTFTMASASLGYTTQEEQETGEGSSETVEVWHQTRGPLTITAANITGVYDTGFTDGQANANAVIKANSITYDNSASYVSNKLFLDISATPQLVLGDGKGNSTPTDKTASVDTVEIAAVPTAAALSRGSFENGKFTITGSGGNVRIGGSGGAGTDIPVSVTTLDLPISKNWYFGTYGQSSQPAQATGSAYCEIDTDHGESTAAVLYRMALTSSITTPTFTWDSTNHQYTYALAGEVKADNVKIMAPSGTATPLTPTEAINYGKSEVGLKTPEWLDSTDDDHPNTYLISTDGRVNSTTGDANEEQTYLTPTDAITHGQNSVSAKLVDNDTSTDAPATLVNGHTYKLYRTIDGTAESTALGTYSVPEGGGTPRSVRSLSRIELDSADIGIVTKTTIPIYSDGNTDTTARNIEIDASAVYNAGVDFGYGGTIDVLKSAWSSGQCTFYPSAGTGARQTVTISAQPVIPSALNAFGTFRINDTTDSASPIQIREQQLQLQKLNGYVNLAWYNGYSYQIIARVSAEGAQTDRYVSSLGNITLTSADIGTSTKYPLITYTDNSTDQTKSLTVDASAVYSAGLAAGSGLSIEPNRVYGPVTANNTYVIEPSTGYGVMANTTVTVNVDQTISGAIINHEADTIGQSWSRTLGTGTLTKKYGQVKINGPDNRGEYYIIDASEVYTRGVSDGADTSGYQVVPSLTLQGTPNNFINKVLYEAGSSVVGVSGSPSTVYVQDSSGTDVIHRGAKVTSIYHGFLYKNEGGSFERVPGTGSGYWFYYADRDTMYLGNGTAYKRDTSNYYRSSGTSYTAIGTKHPAYYLDSSGQIIWCTPGQTYTNTYYIKKSS